MSVMAANTAHRMRLRFRDILAGDVCIHPGSVHDAISARIAGSLGFELAMFAGSVASLAVLGAPDIVVLTLTEFAEQARRICRAAPLPVLVDADHGYGNALNVMRTVQELEIAGIAALTIEDTDLPTPFATPKPTLLSIEEGAGKIAAALAARDDPLMAATSLPIILGSAPPSLGDKAKLAESRVRISLQGHQPFAASVQAIHATLKALRDGTAPGAIGGVAPAGLMREVTAGEDYETWARRFLGG
jgi:carboxyvinyl-carboxyphosphonate phosphorylmutase